MPEPLSDSAFDSLLATFRPRLHRYCARMLGSAIDGEDLVQETLLRALAARGSLAGNPEGWLIRIAHNAALDTLRARARHPETEITEDLLPAAAAAEPGLVSASFQSFLALAPLSRAAVVLKDVLGHSVEEIAGITGSTPAAAKSALQRGRAQLKARAAQEAAAVHLPLLDAEERRRLTAYVAHFRAGAFEAIRDMLAEEVRLELVNRIRLDGRERVGVYFSRYAEVAHWRYALGAVEGRPAMLVFDARGAMARPSHFALIGWRGGRIATIRDFLFAPYALEAADWLRLDEPAG